MSCVTSVDYEHVELLGSSLELIASDKSDACAADGIIVYGENIRGLRPHLTNTTAIASHAPVRPRPDHDQGEQFRVRAAIRSRVRRA